MAFKKGHKTNVGAKRSQEWKDNMSKIMKLRAITWGDKISEAKKGHSWPEGYHERQSLAQRKRFDKEDVWNKGMVSSTRSHRQSETEFRKHSDWRREVFKRDNYTCQKCKAHGVRIEADHIKMWFLYADLRYEISNGQTLCKECHKEKTSKELSIYWTNQFKSSSQITK